MGNGVSSASRSDEDDILSSPFPTFGGFTIEEATVNDIIKGRSLCANIVKLTRGYKPVDEADFMNHFAPMILFYDQFYEELVAQHPNSVLLSKSMLFRLTFLSELIANMLSLDCTANEEENSVSCRVEASFEQREMLQQWVAKYESEDIYQSEYGDIGEAIVSTLSDTHCGDKDWWKIYMWRRVYSHFLRTIGPCSSKEGESMDLCDRVSSIDLA